MSKTEAYKDADHEITEIEALPADLPAPPPPIVPKIQTAYSLIFEGRAYYRGELSGIWYPYAEKIDHEYWARFAEGAKAAAQRRQKGA